MDRTASRTEDFWFWARVEGPKVKIAVTQCYCERFTSMRCQNDRTGMLKQVFERRGPWDT